MDPWGRNQKICYIVSACFFVVPEYPYHIRKNDGHESYCLDFYDTIKNKGIDKKQDWKKD